MSNTEFNAVRNAPRPSLMAPRKAADSAAPKPRRVLAGLGAQWAATRRKRIAASWACGLAAISIGGLYGATRTSPANPSAQPLAAVSAMRVSTPTMAVSSETPSSEPATAAETVTDKSLSKPERSRSAALSSGSNRPRAQARGKAMADARKRAAPDPDTELLAAILRRNAGGMP
ncbi:hypothetical protein [Variovorax saccharolyticus]|uniref:hypothetical protein n=1 Tax=Variovorax saccharolyticus TaxID=3053516 RepID=UPI0025782FF5|nr:hypothetical protein [Variovorax sp. J22R187]MDM0019298.1 hypothetical protein [Variovorax sp. J22R187]